MNIVYTIRESPHRWWILAGLAFLLGMLGAMAMLAYAWPRPLATAWLLLGLTATAIFLVLRFLQWKADVEAEFEAVSRTPAAGSHPEPVGQ